MEFSAKKVLLTEILHLRSLFLEEENTQIRYNAVHERNWSDSYLLSVDTRAVGYGSVMGQERADRDTIFEYYILPSFRQFSSALFGTLLQESKVSMIEAQSNNPLLSSMLFEFAEQIRSNVILFSDHHSTDLAVPGANFRLRGDNDRLFKHHHEPEGTHVVEIDGLVVATGGFLLHYNKPFSDLYMEVSPEYRRQGIGSYLIQEVKKACYLSGRIPAARCDIENLASKSTLLKAGMQVSGYMLLGKAPKTG
ncbi:MAG TPA: GNAT family N-acetyltransferase [Puia sp.]|nr:GNAT family N-acetyltransferase [Puia sp.]